MVKSRPYVLWLVVGAVVLAIWLAWSVEKKPADGQPRSVLVTPAPPVASSAAPVASGNGVPTPLPTVSAVVSGTAQSPGATSALNSAAASQTSSTPVAALYPGESGAPNQAAQIDVRRVRHMISDYHTLMGENPVGTNAEIMKQMIGDNPRQATLGPPDGISLNAKSELVDQWGTPYFFHQLSRDQMEIRSAGPDKVMWTEDDVITR